MFKTTSVQVFNNFIHQKKEKEIFKANVYFLPVAELNA
jgi:hypothetical protein